MCSKLTLMCIEISYYHSAKSISCSKNLMYSTAAVALRKFKKKVYNRSQSIKSSSECC